MTDDIKDKLDALASSIATSASMDGVLPFPDKLDAFKALTAYYLGVTKVSKKKNDEDDPTEKGETFDGFRKSVEASGE